MPGADPWGGGGGGGGGEGGGPGSLAPPPLFLDGEDFFSNAKIFFCKDNLQGQFVRTIYDGCGYNHKFLLLLPSQIEQGVAISSQCLQLTPSINNNKLITTTCDDSTPAGTDTVHQCPLCQTSHLHLHHGAGMYSKC